MDKVFPFGQQVTGHQGQQGLFGCPVSGQEFRQSSTGFQAHIGGQGTAGLGQSQQG